MKTKSAILLGKTIFTASRLLKLGGGYAAPGLHALKVDSYLIQNLATQIPINIFITGTNGKTTTSSLLAHVLKKQNLKVIRNSTGSNLERGIASTLLMHASLTGKISADIGVWEVDEAAFNTLLPKIKPQITIFLNAFRDQLDRYGEVDTVIKKWWHTLEKVNWKMQIITNQGDVNTGYIGSISKLNHHIQNLSYFVKDHLMDNEMSLNQKMKPEFKGDINAQLISQQDLSSTSFKITYPTGNIQAKLNLPGIYNIYNCLAVFCTWFSLNLPIKIFPSLLNDFTPSFGRVEKLKYKEKELILFLIKNPVGTTQVLETIMPVVKKDDVLLTALNDNFADGTDVSWIWDAEFEALTSTQYELAKMKQRTSSAIKKEKSKKNTEFKEIFVTGTRAYDLALRLNMPLLILRESLSTTISTMHLKMRSNPHQVESSSFSHIPPCLKCKNYSKILE